MMTGEDFTVHDEINSDPNFDPFRFRINLRNRSREEFYQDITLKSVFIHEYLHYIQYTFGFMARDVIPDYWKVLIHAGYILNGNGEAPTRGSYVLPFNLLQTLEKANPNDLEGKIVVDDYQGVIEDIMICVEPCATECLAPSSSFFDIEDQTINGHELSFVVLNISDGNRQYRLRLVDGVIFESFSRAVQLLFLHRNEVWDHRYRNREGVDEIQYKCIYLLLRELLELEEDDILEFVVVVCTTAMLCQNPGLGIIHQYNVLNENTVNSLEQYLDLLKTSEWFQEQLDDCHVYQFYNTMSALAQHLSEEDIDVMEDYLLKIHNMFTTLKGNLLYFARSILSEDVLQDWIVQFGCPDIFINEPYRLERPWGIVIDNKWLDYYYHGFRLLSGT